MKSRETFLNKLIPPRLLGDMGHLLSLLEFLEHLVIEVLKVLGVGLHAEQGALDPSLPHLVPDGAPVVRVGAEPHRDVLVLFPGPGHQLAQAEGVELRGGHPGGQGLRGERHHRGAGPQHVHTWAISRASSGVLI